MGRKMDILLGRTLSSKLKPLLALALAHLAALKNQHHVRCSLARSDVAQLLRIGHHDRALLRVEHMIKDQNMFDVFVMIERNCHILMERAILFEYQKDCPNELKDAMSSVIFAASRCGECPELHEIRRVLTTRYGNEFAAAAVEFPKNCGVNLKMIEKMSNKSPSLESKLMVVKEIATENGIIVDLNLSQKQVHPQKPKSGSVGGSKKNYVTATKKEDVYKWNKLDLEEQSSASIPTRVHIDVASADQTDSQDRGLNHLSNVIPKRRNGFESEKRDDRLSRLGAEFEETYARKSKDMSTELCEGGSGCEKFHSASEEAQEYDKLELGSQNKGNHVMSCTERRYELGTPHLNSEDQHSAQHSNTEKKPASVRTRRDLKQ